jgi:hypothetical protein
LPWSTQMFWRCLNLQKLLNESIPHLGAALFGHVFGTAWSCYRVLSTQSLRVVYQNQIVPEACDNQDLLGDWWGIRIQHAVCSIRFIFFGRYWLKPLRSQLSSSTSSPSFASRIFPSGFFRCAMKFSLAWSCGKHLW